MNFAFLAFNNLEELDLMGPWELLGGGLRNHGPIEEAFIIAETKEVITCAKDLKIVPHYSFQDCPEFDFLHKVLSLFTMLSNLKNPY